MNKKSAMGQRIQELRKDAGLTQEQLAQRIGVSMAAVRNYENGLREPNSKAMAALERFFKVSGEYSEVILTAKPSSRIVLLFRIAWMDWWVCFRPSNWTLTAAPRSGKCWLFPSCLG